MSVTSNGPRASDFAAASLPNPAPMMTTRAGIACHEECLPDGAVLPRDLASMPVWKFAGVLFHFTSI
jgi:hypothetical protein